MRSGEYINWGVLFYYSDFQRLNRTREDCFEFGGWANKDSQDRMTEVAWGIHGEHIIKLGR